MRDFMNRREIEEIMRLHRELNNREDFRILKEFRNFDRSNARSILENELLRRNNHLDSINSLQKTSKRENQLLKPFKDILNPPQHSIIEELKRKMSSLTSQDQTINQLKLQPTERISNWQKQTTLALSMKRDEIDKIFNQRELITEIKNRSSLFSSNFLDRNYWNEIEKIRDTFIGNLTVSMRDAIFDSENEQEALEKIETLVEEKLESLPQDGFTRVELLTIIISILGLLLTFYQSALSTYQFLDSQKSSQEQKASTEKVILLLEKIVDNTNPVEDGKDIYYIVERNVDVKRQPSYKSLTVDYLPSNAKVRLLQSNHKWIFIEYVDYLEVVPRYGWVSKKYLKRLEK